MPRFCLEMPEKSARPKRFGGGRMFGFELFLVIFAAKSECIILYYANTSTLPVYRTSDVHPAGRGGSARGGGERSRFRGSSPRLKTNSPSSASASSRAPGTAFRPSPTAATRSLSMPVRPSLSNTWGMPRSSMPCRPAPTGSSATSSSGPTRSRWTTSW